MSDLISREAAIEAAEVYPEDGVIGWQRYWFTMGAMAAREAIRALPAAPEAGEAALPLIADYLRAPHMDAKREIDERARTWIDGNPDPWVNAMSSERDALRARLAEVEAERDAALVRLENLRAAIVAKGGNEHYPTEDAYLAACRAVDKHRARANAAEAALAAQGEPVAWAEMFKSGKLASISLCRDDYRTTPLYPHPAPASAGVSVKPLDLRNAVQAGFDAWAAKPHNKKWARKIYGTPIPNDVVVCIQTAVCATLSQPAQDTP